MRCTRYPCDSAYRRHTHKPDKDGVVHHRTSVGRGLEINAPDKPLEWGWSVDVVAPGDERWLIRVRLGDRYMDLDNKEAEEFVAQVVRGAAWADQSRAADLQRRISELERRLDYWLDQVDELDEAKG